MIGRRVLHYTISRELGRGGMGVVYEAQDARLDRRVALKFLPRHAMPTGEERQRFNREARAAAALSHPHIAHVYAVEEVDDEPFIVMEYVDGTELRSVLSGERPAYARVLEIGLQIAGALKAAHERGIVHRDLKTANIMLTRDGFVKVMDFGLAKRGEDRQLTQTGVVMGTLDYMSPEQVRGEAVDPRTDIWSAGVVLYELMAGSRPFAGDSAAALMHAILHDGPKPLANTPAGFTALVARMLTKRRDDRLASMAEVAIALDQLKVHAAQPQHREDETVAIRPQLPALAVLPFTSIRDDPETRFLGFALADQIISALSYAGSLTVRPSSAVRKYQQQGVDAPTAGRELHVEFVLAGHYLKEGETIRLNVELVAASANNLVWRETIDVRYENAFQLQDIVSEKVLRGLNLSFAQDGTDRRTADAPGDPQAYEYYLRAVAYPITLEGSQLAIKMLEVAIGRNASFAPAHAELGFRLNEVAVEAMQGFPAFRKVENALKTALSLNDRLLPALWHLARLYVNSGRIRAALALIERLSRVAPGTALPHFALGYLLRYAGLLEESAREIERALDLDPRNPRFRSAGFTYLFLGDYQLAYDAFDLDRGSSVSIGIQGIALLLMGNKTRACEYFDRVIAMEPESFVARRVAVVRAFVLGHPQEAGRLMRDLESASANETDSEHWYLMAEVYGLLGDAEPCARLLERAVSSGFFSYPAMLTNPFLDAVRGQREVQQVLGQARHKHEDFKAHLFERWKGVFPLVRQ